ncbi:MAG: helicase-exonuclease AddAB subunit AddA [Selenomonadaceae bacterium]|nr:helicase-exonuclease AddAB subunit AddA [Selenomonadaceae bacterium]MBQ9496563.1 helicase-exonuclease AddAB subunit AddA [Selenomonadaceae bacterium]
MELTREQQEAVDARGENLLVAAAAGAGKTRTLTERVVRLLEENSCEVDELLIMTFTNAAAQEMRARIQAALMKRLETELDAANQARLEKQIILLSGAQISTFHSFCQTVLRRNFSRIDLDPKFRAAEDNELEILKREVIEELFEENYPNDTFKKFTDEFGGNVRGDEKIHDMILALHKFSMSMAYPDAWLDKLADPYDLPEDARLEDTHWFKFLKPYILQTLQKIFDECAEASLLAGKNKITAKALTTDRQQIDALKNSLDDWNELYDKIHAIDFKRFALGKGDEQIKSKIKSLRDAYKKKIETLREKYFLADENKMLSDIRELHAPIKELIRVTKLFAEKFSDAKRERGIIDFNDMEHFALKIFDAAPEVAAAYREKFKFIMVDEYQDTNGVQEAIVQKISRGDNLFFVGDVKQSVYRFRLVDAENFRDKMDSYRCINLSKNFRSREKIITAANEIFKRLMNRRATEIDYDAAAQLQFGASYEVGEKFFDERPEFFFIKPEKNPDDDVKAIEVEMKFIAGKIHELIASKKLVRDGEIYRPVQFKDIVILHRSPKTTAFEILDTLKKFGVPAYVPDEENYFRANEIQVVMSLLNLLDNARQDIPLAAVMLSPIGGFSAEELAEVRIANPDGDFYTAVSRGSDKCKNFLGKLNLWREAARQIGVPELLSNLYRATGYYDSVGREERGEARQANLRILIDRATKFESTNARGLSRFIEFIGKLKDSGQDLATATTLGENENVVRVVTIHKSKGLEYPVVFVAGVGKQFNAEDYTRANIFMHKEFGVGVYRTPKDSQLKVRTLATQAVAKKIADESISEELRLLYVAITRAEEKLFLVGTTSKTALGNLRQVDTPDDYEILSAGKFMDWLLPIKDALEPFMRSHLVEQMELDAIQPRTLERAEEKISRAPEKLQPTPLEKIPAKLSVTELKRRAEEEELPLLENFAPKKFLYRRPNFMQKKEMSGAEFGSLMHKVMQSLNLGGDLSPKGIVAQVEELARREIIPSEHAGQIRTEKISKFFASEIGRRLVAAQEFYRELPFSRLIDAQKFFHVDEKIFVQGIIDLLFKDAAGQWVLLDYKTDKDTEDIAERYRVQIDLYAAAVEALLKIKVAEKYLYLLGGGRLVKM